MDVVELVAGSVAPIKVHFATLSDLDSVPMTGGWYAWMHIPSAISKNALQLYRHSRVESSVKGIFNLEFKGRLKVTDDDALAFGEMDEEFLETVRSLFLAFAPPLYVGISTNLRSRLKSHRKNLQQFMHMADTTDIAFASAGINSDSERESQFFGARVGAALRALSLSPDDLHVKCVIVDNPKLLKKVEKILNFALTPHYGRK